jgi:lipid-A-disaccharide synthase
MIVAGEASGDLHGAKLVRELRKLTGELEVFGAAGPQLRAEGVEPIVRADGLSIVGIPEIAVALPTLLRAFSALKSAAIARRPDAVVFVDFPDFNLKLARSLKRRGFTTVYYISPQLWAWRRYRLRTVKKYVDLVITILPFEKDWYASGGYERVEYVGSPLAREVQAGRSRDEFCRDHGLSPDRPLIALLPGSRHKEIVHVLPPMLEAAGRLAKRLTDVQFVVALAPGRGPGEVDEAAEACRSRGISVPALTIVEGETFDALNAADAAAVTSGTATLEAGIIGTPMAIVYKTSAFNYKLLRPLIEVDHFGLINLIAGERVAKELIQDDFTPELLAAELERILEPDVNADLQTRLAAATDKLGHGGASERAAKAILTQLKKRS